MLYQRALVRKSEENIHYSEKVLGPAGFQQDGRLSGSEPSDPVISLINSFSFDC
jgi:hypothetical protein